MIRLILERVLLFLLPFALYLIYLRLRTNDENTPTKPHPWTVLFVSGLVLVAVSFLYLGATGGTGQRGTYVPPRVEDGRVVPGRVEPGRSK